MKHPVIPFHYLFGILTIAGGVMGYVTVQSLASLIAGSVAGILILVAALLEGGKFRVPGLILGLVISLALIGRFLPPFLSTWDWMPAGLMSIFALISIVLTLHALLVKSK